MQANSINLKKKNYHCFVQGTGMCGDILAYAAQNVTEKKIVSTDADGKQTVE
jgi:hypothetical protein